MYMVSTVQQGNEMLFEYKFVEPNCMSYDLDDIWW